MAGSKLSMVVFMVMMVAAMQMQTSMAQTRHVVGDALGWNIPPNGAAAYTTWASGKTFTVGDTLFFNFTTGVHDVAEVSQAAYGPCTATNPISMVTTGPATVTLSTAGTHYYICTFGTHCSTLGQKVSVNVVSAATAPTTPPPAATPTTPPPAATPTTPPPTATPTPAPTSPPTTTPTPAPAPAPTTTTTSPTPRASHSLNFFKGCLLLFGGGSEGGRHLDDTWIAYIGNGFFTRMIHWQRLVSSSSSDTPSGRFGHSCVVIGDSLVLFGGINDSGIRQNDTWIARHHTNTLSWTLLDVGPVSPPTRGAHACCSLDNHTMLIHGGIGLSGMRLGDTWVLHLSDNLSFGTWHQSITHPSPSPRSGHTLTYIGGGSSRTVLFGGRGMGYEVLNDVWYFDSSQPPHFQWVPVLFDLTNITGGAGTSLPRVGHSATLILGGRVLIYGGEDSYRHRKNDFWLLDITSSRRLSQDQRMIWRRLKCDEGHQPRSRSFHRACADESGRYLYVFGGMVDGVLQPAQPTGLRFDGELFAVKLLL